MDRESLIFNVGLGRPRTVVLVVNGRGGTSKITDLVDLDIERKSHVVADQFKFGATEQTLDVAAAAGEEIVDSDDVPAFLDEAFDQTRAEKAGAAPSPKREFRDAYPVS